MSTERNSHVYVIRSYSVRTVLGPFDRQFNAITGLNGSGKSNVLDGICFVLGITNLSKVCAVSHKISLFQRSERAICLSWCINKARLV